MHILFILQTVFSLWLLTDAIKRGAPQYWWFIIMVPFGEWAYFFAVKLPDMRFTVQLRRKLFTRPMSLAQVQLAFEQTPSHENRVLLAQSLHDRGKHQEAADHFEIVLRENEDDKDSLYGYAMCCLRIGNREMAKRALARLVDIDITYGEYVACSDIAELLDQDDERAQAIAILRRAVKKSQRIGPRHLLARYLSESGRRDEACQILRAGLGVYESSPKYVRRRDRRDANAARSLLRSIS